jgi:hypothetical protein
MIENVAATATTETQPNIVPQTEIKPMTTGKVPNAEGKIELAAGESLEWEDIVAAKIVPDLSKSPGKTGPKADIPKTTVVEAEAPAPEEGTELETKAEAKDPSPETKPKVYQAKKGDENLELTGTTEIQIKVNGKLETVKVEDLVSQYNGSVVYNKKFEALSKERKSLETEKGQFESVLTDVMSAIEAQDLDLLLRTAAKQMRLSDEQAETAIQNYYKSAIERIKSFESLTPAERELQKYKTQEKQREYLSKREEQFKTAEQAKNQMTERISTIMQRSNIDTETFISRYEELHAFAKENPQVQITPESVENYHLDCIRYETADNVIKSLPPKTIPEAQVAETQDFIRNTLLEDPSLTEKDLSEILLQAYGAKPKKAALTAEEKKAVAAKVKSTQPQVESKKQFESRQVYSGKGPLTFDDL